MSARAIDVACITLIFGSVVNCSKPSNDSTPPAVSSSAPTASPSATASAAPAPNMKDITMTPSDKLGTLAPNTGVPVGQKVPDVHGRDLDGKDISLSALYAKGPLLLVFYRGGWCPYCNSEIHSLTMGFPEFQKRGVTPVAVSVDTPDREAKLKATYTIPFPVLSDSDAAIIEAFHVVNHVDDATLAKMKGFGLDLESYSGKPHHEI
ncbi:MAG TPA: peroxiredoxin family protein, partial [Polyangiaceae bacterium]